MIGTLLKAGWLNLRRDRVAQALTFLLPIVFFSIFASVFGGQGDGTSRIRVGVVDEDHSELSARIIAGLEKETALRVRRATDNGAALDRRARHQVGIVRHLRHRPYDVEAAGLRRAVPEPALQRRWPRR